MLIYNPEAFSEPDVTATIGGNSIRRMRMPKLDREFIQRSLVEPNTVNLFNIPLAINNDGIAIVDRGSWQFRSVDR